LKGTPEEGTPEYDPNFVFGGKRIISEDNWPEYEAQGVGNVIDAIPEEDDAIRRALSDKVRIYGDANILLGDAFDADAGRPLRHKPGIGIYATAQGIEDGRHRYPDAVPHWLRQPPVLKMPDGRRIVARPGKRVKIRRSDAPAGDADTASSDIPPEP
jgi:hypothetical protein